MLISLCQISIQLLPVVHEVSVRRLLLVSCCLVEPEQQVVVLREELLVARVLLLLLLGLMLLLRFGRHGGRLGRVREGAGQISVTHTLVLVAYLVPLDDIDVVVEVLLFVIQLLEFALDFFVDLVSDLGLDLLLY